MSRFFIYFIALVVLSLNSQAQVPSSSNPAMGINALMLYKNSNRGNDALSEQRNGLDLQEAEMQFSSDVDPYWRFVSTFSVHQDVTVDAKTTPPTRTAHYVIEPEEAFAESLDFRSVTVRVGKFKAAFGKHNTLHTHAFAFIDAPLMSTQLLGDEGLNDTGLSAAVLLPFSWFSEVSLQALSGQGEGLDYFHSPSANSSVGVAHLKNLFDLSEELTFEVGLSGATGENSMKEKTNLRGADLTFKWRQDKSHALIWSTELIGRDRNQATNERGKGFASWVQWQSSQRWWTQVRGEYLEMKNQDPAATSMVPDFQKKQSFLIGFIPSEFSGIRLQYDRLDDGSEKPEQKIALQFNYSIGAHPAHAY